MSVTTYHCGWCGWNGTRIGEQATGDGHYCCWQCGLPVKPGPHGQGGAGVDEVLKEGQCSRVL